MNLRIKPENEVTERDRKIVGCIQSSADRPISFAIQKDQTICLYHGDVLKGCMDLELFDQLEPHEILKRLDVAIDPYAGKF